jgi:hypothetical protein
LGIKIIMLSGDNKQTAEYIAKSLGIDNVIAEVMPQQKLQKIIELQKAGRVVAMAGDGINDAPALAQANVGIAMGSGTDVAIETADVTLLKGDIAKIAVSIKLARATMFTIKHNLFWAFGYNIIGIPLAALGLSLVIQGFFLAAALCAASPAYGQSALEFAAAGMGSRPVAGNSGRQPGRLMKIIHALAGALALATNRTVVAIALVGLYLSAGFVSPACALRVCLL